MSPSRDFRIPKLLAYSYKIYGIRILLVCRSSSGPMAAGVEQSIDIGVKAVHEHLRDAITGVLAQKDFNLHSDRCHKLQEFGKELVTKITTEDEATTTAMSEFMTALLPILDGILQEASSARTCAVQRERAWSKFHQSRCATIGKLWEDLEYSW